MLLSECIFFILHIYKLKTPLYFTLFYNYVKCYFFICILLMCYTYFTRLWTLPSALFLSLYILYWILKLTSISGFIFEEFFLVYTTELLTYPFLYQILYFCNDICGMWWLSACVPSLQHLSYFLSPEAHIYMLSHTVCPGFYLGLYFYYCIWLEICEQSITDHVSQIT